jgi:hypothetical protein
MSVAYYAEIPDVTPEQVQRFSAFVDQLRQQLVDTGGLPEGPLFYATGPTDNGGWWTFHLFETAEHFGRFHDALLAPAFVYAGLASVVHRRLEVFWDSVTGG